jgi:Fe-S oxidoreductase
MAKIFFPSCQTKMAYPGASEKLHEYLITNYGIEITGCCRNDHRKLSPEDTAIVICNTCFSVLERISNAGEIISIWEIIDSDFKFFFPNYNGEKITVQDCMRATNRNKVHNAVRSLLKKMNMEPIELNENRDKSRFCGMPTFMPRPVQNTEFEQKRYGTASVERFKEYPEEDRINFIKEHTKQFTTDRAVSYCISCDAGIKMGGKKSASLINLIFNEIT